MPETNCAVLIAALPPRVGDQPAPLAGLRDQFVHGVGDGVDQRQIECVVMGGPQLRRLTPQTPNLILKRIESAGESGGRSVSKHGWPR